MKAAARGERGWARVAARVAVAAGVAGVAGVVAAACTDSPAPSSAAPAAAQALCPATPEDTIGAACAVSGLQCGPQYTCGFLQVALLCVCTDGVFQCTDGTGQELDSADAIACPRHVTTSVCPASERVAQLASCSEQGLLCSYPSTCPSRLDPCQCSPGATADGGFGLRFECRPAICATEGGATIPDAGSDARPLTDAVADGPTDATLSVDADAAAAADSDAATGTEASADVGAAEASVDGPSGDAVPE